MQKHQIRRAQARLAAAGFTPAQVAAYPAWVGRLENRRQWRRLTRRVFGVSVK